MNKKIIAAIILSLVVAASGCASTDNGPESKKDANHTYELDYGDIRKVEMEDATCYVYDHQSAYAGAGGISCNFDNQ